MKSLLELWRTLAEELASWVGTSTTDDYKTIIRRVEHEGESFLTISLGEFGKDFEQALFAEFIDSTLFKSYRKRKGSELPSFLWGFLSLVFDSKTGRLLDVPDHFSIFAIRQLTLLFTKIGRDCSQSRTDRAVVQYLKTDQEVAEFQEAWRSAKYSGVDPREHTYTRIARKGFSSFRLNPDDFVRVSNLLFGDILSKIDKDVYEGNLVPKHGPGKTADRLSGNAKFDQQEWTQRLEEVFPYGEYALPSWRSYYRLESVTFLSPDEERPVRVVLVPKTLKTPRVIAIEPTCMQYMQQAVAERLVRLIEDDSVLKKMIGFTDQVPNQDLAREGSLHGNFATLDLSEASDRVSNEHVRSLLANHPWLSAGVDACRSRKARVPGYFRKPETVIELAKFASMGSALTFPLEAMVFLTVVVLAKEQARGRRYKSRNTIQRELDGARIYGDDIIVPTDIAESVIEYLELYGFKVNTSKSFWTGKFRESCGKEFYDGTNVSITRVRRDFPQSRKDVPEILSLVSLRNQFYQDGLWETARFLEDVLVQHFPIRLFPAIQQTSPLVGRYSFLRSSFFMEGDVWDDRLQIPLVKGYEVISRLPVSTISGEGALLKWFLKRGDLPFDEKHLERAGRPDSVYLKIRQAPPF